MATVSTSPFDRHVDAIQKRELMALRKVIAHFGSNTAMGNALGMSSSAVVLMLMRGKVGRYAALIIDADPGIPFKLEDLRSDYRDLRKLSPLTKPGRRGLSSKAAAA